MGGRVEEAIAQAEQLRTGAPADVDAALLLASLYASRERTADAVPVIRQVLDAHPDSVELLGALAMIYVRAGNPAEALRVYERCRRFLADELGAYPSPESKAVYLEILRSSPGSSGSEIEGLTPDARRPESPPKNDENTPPARPLEICTVGS